MNLNFDSYKCWEIEEKDYPFDGIVEEKIKFILGYGILAPSTFNSQPWKCKLEGNTLQVYLDRDRITQKSDKAERFAHISMGAFIENILIAADYFGLKAGLKFTTHSKKSKIQHIASISFSESKKNKNELFHAIKQRSTNRSPSKNKKIEIKILKKISALQNKALQIISLDEKFKNEIITISKQGDHNIWTDFEFRREHVAWVRTNLTKKYDGMPGFGVNANLFTSFLATPVILSPIFPKFQAIKNEKAIKSTKHFLVICSVENFDTWIKIGMLYEEIALFLTNHKISVSPMGQFIEDIQARNMLHKLIKPKKNFSPQVFMRLGYSSLKVPHSPRYPVKKILI